MATVALLSSRWPLRWADCAHKVYVAVTVLLVLVFYSSVGAAQSATHHHNGPIVASQLLTGSSLSSTSFSEACCAEASSGVDAAIPAGCAINCGALIEHCDHSSCDVACCMLVVGLPSPYFVLSHISVSAQSFLSFTVGTLAFEVSPAVPPPKV